MVVSEFSECDFRNVPAASEVIDSESFGLALGLPADCADARSSSWPSSSEHKLRNGDDSGVAGSVCGVLGEGDDGLLCMLRRQARPSRGAAKLDSTKQKRLGDCGCTALPRFAGWRGRELGSGDCGNAGSYSMLSQRRTPWCTRSNEPLPMSVGCLNSPRLPPPTHAGTKDRAETIVATSGRAHHSSLATKSVTR